MLGESRPAPQASPRKKWILGALAVLLVGSAIAVGVLIGHSSSSSSSSNEAQLLLQNVDEYGAPVELLGSSSGHTEVYGRIIDWKASTYISKLKLKYKATATDRATGIKGSASGLKSGKGAVEHAIEDCFKNLQANGLLLSAEQQQTTPTLFFVLPAVKELESEMSEQEIEKAVVPALKQGGSTVIAGRTVRYDVAAYRSGLTLKWKGTATDVATGLAASVKGLKSAKGAVEHACEELFKILISHGIVVMVAEAEPLPVIEGQDFFNSQEVPLLQGGTSGVIEVGGRNFRWTATPYRSGLTIHWKGSATDFATGIAGVAKTKSAKGCVEHAVADCFQKLIAAGHVKMNAESDVAAPLFGSVATSASLQEEAEVEMPEALTGKSGNIDVHGRRIRWKASGYLKGLSWRYKASATDTATGKSASSSGHKSGKGSVEGAVKKLFERLVREGDVVVPQGQKQMPDVTLYELTMPLENEVEGEDEIGFDDAEDDVLIPFLTSDSDSEIEPLERGVHKRAGSVKVYGRDIDWEFTGQIRTNGFVYEATATDRVSKLQTKVSGHPSGIIAVRKATTELFKLMKANGVI